MNALFVVVVVVVGVSSYNNYNQPTTKVYKSLGQIDFQLSLGRKLNPKIKAAIAVALVTAI